MFNKELWRFMSFDPKILGLVLKKQTTTHIQYLISFKDPRFHLWKHLWNTFCRIATVALQHSLIFPQRLEILLLFMWDLIFEEEKFVKKRDLGNMVIFEPEECDGRRKTAA